MDTIACCSNARGQIPTPKAGLFLGIKLGVGVLTNVWGGAVIMREVQIYIKNIKKEKH